MRDIDELGMHTVLKKTLEILGDCKHLHLSLDMDSIDPNEAPGVGTPVAGGLNYLEAQLLMETVHDIDCGHSISWKQTPSWTTATGPLRLQSASLHRSLERVLSNSRHYRHALIVDIQLINFIPGLGDTIT